MANTSRTAVLKRYRLTELMVAGLADVALEKPTFLAHHSTLGALFERQMIVCDRSAASGIVVTTKGVQALQAIKDSATPQG